MVDGSLVALVNIYEVADKSGQFRQIAFGPALRSIPKYKILRDEPWHRGQG